MTHDQLNTMLFAIAMAFVFGWLNLWEIHKKLDKLLERSESTEKPK